jgi:hypothetical protein
MPAYANILGSENIAEQSQYIQMHREEPSLLGCSKLQRPTFLKVVNFLHTFGKLSLAVNHTSIVLLAGNPVPNRKKENIGDHRPLSKGNCQLQASLPGEVSSRTAFNSYLFTTFEAQLTWFLISMQVAAVTVLCVQSEASYRPLIADVVQSLVPLVPQELGGALRQDPGHST